MNREESRDLVAELWRCPRCGERFTTRHQWHSCGKFDLEPLFDGTAPYVRELFDRFLTLVEECGPVTVIPQKTRVAFQVRMRFAAVMPQKRSLKGHLVLAQRHDAPCFERIDGLSPRNHVHVFRLDTTTQITAELARFVKQAYQVGCQEHLRK